VRSSCNNPPSIRIPRFTILSLLIVTAVIATAIACSLSVHKFYVLDPLHEAKRIEQLNQQYYSRIFRRCDGVAELRKFLELYNPVRAIEKVDNEKKVVSVSCYATIDDRYTADAHAQVQINKDRSYDLVGKFNVRIVDSVGKFTTIDGNTTYSGQSVDLNSTQWAAFVDGGANIDSIRRIRRVDQALITQNSEGQ